MADCNVNSPQEGSTDTLGKSITEVSHENNSAFEKDGTFSNVIHEKSEVKAIFHAIDSGDVEALQTLLSQDEIDLNGLYDQSGLTPLMHASTYGKVEVIDYLVQAGASLDIVNSHFDTALICAIKSDQVLAAKSLVTLGADPNMTADINSKTPLIYAVERGLSELISDLFENGADLNEVDDKYETPLIKAYTTGQPEIVQALVKYGADVNKSNEKKDTVLILAARAGDTDMVNFFINSGGDLNAKNIFNFTPLLAAVLKRHVDVVYYLVKAGAELDLGNIYGDTAMTIASRNGDLNIMEYLLDGGASLEEQNINIANSAIMHAAFYGQLEAIRFLVSKGADVNGINYDGDSAVFCCCRGKPDNFKDIFQFLVDCGAKLDLMNKRGHHVLLDRLRNIDVVKLLVSAGAPVNLPEGKRKKRTPLMVAAGWGDVEIVKYLLASGSHVNVKDRFGNTALMEAISNNKVEVMEILVEAGEDVEACMFDGVTCLTLAAAKGITEAAQCLIQLGADVNRKELITAESPLSIATKFNHIRMVRLLLQSGAKVDDELHKVIVWGKTRLVQEYILEGTLPLSKMLHIGLNIDNAEKRMLSPFAVALLKGRVNIAKFFISNWYFNEYDVKELPFNSSIRAYLAEEKRHESAKLLADLYTSPWSLVQLSFLTVSVALGFSHNRSEKVQSLNLPTSFKKRLLYQDDTVRIPSNKWAKIPI